MTVTEINAEIESVDLNVDKNTDQKYVLGLVARGVWQIALQLAEANAARADARARENAIL